ncbi:MAG: gluconate 2-dehydrogenase subunit 3 family protein [Gemmatimonadetes bacterium]|nr:gluconate 2-dehydrogenase subunit 3 family protein [Gemmatimonadota bacterium]
MSDNSTSRRDFLAASSAALASLWLTADPEQLRASLAHAAHAATSRTPVDWETFTLPQAADVDAIAAQIIPTDGTPGAREAHAVNFIDHSLANWAKPQAESFLKGLSELNDEVEKRWPGTGGFAKLYPARQMELLMAWDKANKPFFNQVRSAVITGTFSNEEYGGNFQKIGWKIIGFEDRFAWQPPFGAYDVEANKDYGK